MMRRAIATMLVLGSMIIPLGAQGKWAMAQAADEPTKMKGLSNTTTDVFELTASLPVFKIRQGEKFKIFDGVGAGLKISPLPRFRGLHVSVLAMLSATSVSPDGTESDQIQVLSGGVLLGYEWLEIGIGRDLISSQDKDAFDKRSKTFYMLNLGANVKF